MKQSRLSVRTMSRQLWLCSHNLSGKFLVENYKQALGILAGEAQFKRSMEDSGIKDAATFSQWLSDEHEYLKSLSKEPIHETLHMEYYQKLVNLEDTQWVAFMAITQNAG